MKRVAIWPIADGLMEVDILKLWPEFEKDLLKRHPDATGIRFGELYWDDGHQYVSATFESSRG